jgi:hypothetical protein
MPAVEGCAAALRLKIERTMQVAGCRIEDAAADRGRGTGEDWKIGRLECSNV